MTFPKAERKMRGKVGGELWSAGSYGDRPFFGILRCAGTPRWYCPHHGRGHPTTAEARACAAEELARRLSDSAPSTEG